MFSLSLLAITCLHNKAAVVTKMLVKSICLGVQFLQLIIAGDTLSLQFSWHTIYCKLFMVENFHGYRIKSISLENFHGWLLDLVSQRSPNTDTAVKHARTRMWIVTGIVASLNAEMTEKEFEMNVLLHTLQW